MSRSRTAVAKVADAAPLFAALGDETRLRLMARLSGDGPQSTAKLTDTTSVSRQAITKHLRALANAGLVRSRREGRERVWELHAKRLDDARRYLDQISVQWDTAIDRLRAFVEDGPSDALTSRADLAPGAAPPPAITERKARR